MARRLGLVMVLLAGCAEGGSQSDLVSELSVESVAAMPVSGGRVVSMAGIDAERFVVARVTTQGKDFCPQCLDPAARNCAATCRRSVIEVTRYRAGGPADPVLRFHEVFPIQSTYDVAAIDVVALDKDHAGVGWLECDHTACGVSGPPRSSCTARYAAVDLSSGHPQPIATLYQGWYGDLQLAFNPDGGKLLAVLGTQDASGGGVRAAIYDARSAAVLSPWQAYGGVAASAPVAVAEADGFLIAADDPAPAMPAAPEPCDDACNCQQPGVSDQPDSGLYAFHPGLDRSPERIASRRTAGMDGRRPAIAAVAAAGRVHVLVASSRPGDVDAQVFEPAESGWKPRSAASTPVSASTPVPAPRRMGALADATHLAWIGFDESDGPMAQRRLMAGVAAGQRSQRGEIAEVAPGEVLRVAPVNDGEAVKSMYLLRSVQSMDGGAIVPRFEVLSVHAQW